MRRPSRIVVGRVIYIALFVALQAMILLAMFSWFRASFAWYYVAGMVISALSVLHVLGDKSNPAYKIAWIIPILVFPVFGGPFYFMFRRSRLTRREKKKAGDNQSRYRAMLTGREGDMETLLMREKDALPMARYLSGSAAAPVWGHTACRYFPSGEAAYPQLLRDLKGAEKSIFLEFFIVQEGAMWNGILDILEEKARGGVDVRIMYDDVGSMFTLPALYDKELTRRGLRARAFSRFTNVSNSRFNNRDHRKICVVDGKVGYTGGFNLADEYINRRERFGYWKDTAVRMEGDGAASLTALFLSMWDYAAGQTEALSDFLPRDRGREETDGWVCPYADSPLDDENVGENVYLHMISHAKRYIWFTTPYLILDSEMLTALTLAAKSGVDVRIVTPRVPDKRIVFMATRSNYPALMEAGVRIYEYTPGFIHAKMALCDDESAVVGTINLDFRSLFLHYECAAWFWKGPVVRDVKKDMESVFAASQRITPEEAKRIVPRRPLPAILKVFSPMF